MKKLALLIVAAAVVAAYVARNPLPSTPPESPPPSAPPPSLSAPVEPTRVAPPAPEPVTAPENDPGEDPPDVVADRRIAGTGNDLATRAMPELGLMMKADREGERNGCKQGDLLLNGSGIHFACPSDSTKNVALAIAEIKEVNKSGVEASNGHKYHFNIQNTNAEQGEKLFRDWLSQAQSSPK
jgi:hypothetical protein